MAIQQTTQKQTTQKQNRRRVRRVTVVRDAPVGSRPPAPPIADSTAEKPRFEAFLVGEFEVGIFDAGKTPADPITDEDLSPGSMAALNALAVRMKIQAARREIARLAREEE